ncbi:MAG: hypothetical protein KDI73_00390, partial [Candidatus Competibacteraceae bacterium]|nr:hypothetical protein [Candidatus Competibacteraceae bacterium]
DQIGVERLELMSNLRFSVQTPPGGPNYIKVTSVQPIRDPNFDLLVEVVWPRGRLLRTFPVQLDPELYANRQEPPPPLQPTEAPLVEAPAAIAAAPAASGLPPPPPVSFDGASLYGPVRPGENLTRIANQVRPSSVISTSDMMAILLAGNPEAFINGNPNLLRAGAMLKVPSAQALGVQGAPGSEPSTEIAAAAPPGGLSPSEPVSQPPESFTAPESPVAPPSVIATAPESPAPPVSEPSAVITPPVAPPPAIVTAPTSPEQTPQPDAPAVGETAPALAESPPSAPLTPIAPQEIIPQTVVPQAETPPAPEPAEPVAPPEPPPTAETTEPVAAPEPQPAVPAPTPVPEPEETGMEWLSNPIVWIPIALIVLAIAAMLLLPLLRRPKRPQKAAAEPKEPLISETPQEAGEPVASAQTQIRKPRPQKQQPSSLDETGAAAAPAPRPGAVSPPKPIDELLKDIDFGVGNERSRPTMPGGRKGATPVRGLTGQRLPDAEPPTASGTRTPGPAAPTPPEQPKAQPVPKELPPMLQATPKAPPTPAPEQSALEPSSELPSGLKLESLDFELGDLGLSANRNQTPELPPLELQPAERPKTGSRKPLDFDLPAIEPPTQTGSAEELPKPKASDLKFEFADVSQRDEHTNAPEGLAKLDEELLNFGDVDLGKMELNPPSATAEASADYVETKLDLASAYLDMGDQMGARGLLEDVLREGDASQKKRAEEMLKKVV